MLALVTALALGGLVIVFSDPDTLDSWGEFFSHPGRTLSDSWNLVYDSYQGLYTSSLGTQAAIGRTLVEATPLVLAGLSVALAFRAGLFNIGAAGQLMVGATCAGWVGFTWDLPRRPPPVAGGDRRLRWAAPSGAASPASSRRAPAPTR